MKSIPRLFLAATLSLRSALAVAQDDQKPTPPTPPSPPTAPSAATPAPDQKPPPPPPAPSRDGRHHGDHPRPPEDGRRDDSPGQPEGDNRPEGWRRPGWQAPQPMPTKPTSYIGVITTPPPPVLSAQLGLADGFGLVVNDVLPDSPAAKAGVQRYDVLTKFNDQQLVDSGQFSTLVRALKKDTEASLTLIRKGQEQKVTVKIDERALPERRTFPFPGGDYRHGPGEFNRLPMHGQLPQGGGAPGEFGDRMRAFQERMREWQKNPSAERPQPPEPPTTDGNAGIQPEDILREVRPGGVAQIHLLRPDGAVTYNMANAKLVMKDDAGEIELTTHGGKRSLVARNAQGETVFDGPIDTDEQRKALPEDIRKKIDLIEVQRKLAEAPQPAVDAGLLPDVQ